MKRRYYVAQDLGTRGLNFYDILFYTKVLLCLSWFLRGATDL